LRSYSLSFDRETMQRIAEKGRIRTTQMAIAVEMPKLGNTVEECLIARWLKQEGQAVSVGETVVEIETDKTSFEVTAPLDGTVLATFFEQGSLVPVFTKLFVIGNQGDSVEEFRPQLEGTIPAANAAGSEKPTGRDAKQGDRPAATTGDSPPRSSAPLSPRARRFAEEHKLKPPGVSGSGPGGRVLEADLHALYHTSGRVSGAASRRVKGWADAPLEGSGIGGMILASDLDGSETRISGVREKIARRMRESLAGTAQYTLHSSADARGLLLLRARIKASPSGPDININDLVTFCTVQALLQAPELNVWFVDGKIQPGRGVHIGFACDTTRGLLVPVVRNAQALTAAELAVRIKELSGQAVQGKISADDLSGATFTVSNLGGLGIESFTPLLNPPQIAILGVNAIQLKAIRREGKVEFIDAIGLSLTLDHQIIDGAPGARFLKVVRDKIENVERLCTI
jgi:pyruvate dehydrogenase E2 component (dihydrolipoamide acetyltransferase)